MFKKKVKVDAAQTHCISRLRQGLSIFIIVCLLMSCIVVPASATDSLDFSDCNFGNSKGSYDNCDLYVVTVPGTYDTVNFGYGKGYFLYVDNNNDWMTPVEDKVQGILVRNNDVYELAKSNYEAYLNGITLNQGVELNSSADLLMFLLYYEPKDLIEYIILQWEEAAVNQIDADNLRSALEKETGDVYQSKDRYNGKITSAELATELNLKRTVDGFYDIYGDVKERANTELSNPTNQDTVDALAAALTKAKDNLIPITQVNPTELYELLSNQYFWHGNSLKTDTSVNPISEENCSAASWTAYQTARYAAEAELRKLYYQDGDDIPEGKKVGDATPYNSSSGEAATNVDNVTAALRDAIYGNEEAGVSGLDHLTASDNARLAYNALSKLVDKLFNSKLLTASDYTPESWESFESAYQKAEAFLDENDEPGDMIGYKEQQYYINTYKAFWSAAYEGLKPAKTGTAEIHICDSYALLEGINPAECTGSYSITVPEGGITVQEALKQYLGEDLRSAIVEAHQNVGLSVYVNGVYVLNMVYQRAFNDVAPRDIERYGNIQLHDGDTVVLAFCKIPEKNTGGIAASQLRANELFGDLNYSMLSHDGKVSTIVNAVAGEPLELTALTQFSFPVGYNVERIALADARVLLSECFATEEEARQSTAAKDSGITTAADGSFSLSFFTAADGNEGWYVVNVMSTKPARESLTNGANILVRVTDPADLSGIRASLRAELDTVYSAYGNDFYTAEQKAQIDSLYQAGITGIASGASSGEIYAAASGAMTGIKAIQTENEDATAAALANVRLLLAALPSLEDAKAGKVFYRDVFLLEALAGEAGVYNTMTENQRAKLFVNEQTAAEWYKEFYAKPEYGDAKYEYIPSFKLSLEVRDADTNALLTSDQAPIGITTYKIDNCHGIIPGDHGELSLNILSAGVNETYYGRENGSFTAKTEYSTNLTAAYPLTYVDWGFQWPEDDRSGLAYFTNGYEIVSSSISGDEHNYYNEFQYAGGAGATFYPLREDTVITVYVRSTNTPYADYLTKLETVLNGFTKSDYTAESWSVLLAAYHTGIANIKAAADDTERRAALDAATAAMQGVSEKSAGSAVEKWGEGSDFDIGKQVGTVTVSVENTTFPGGDFTGTILSKTGYPLGENDSIMTVVLRALKDEGYSWAGTGSTDDYSISYLASIMKGEKTIGEFSGESGSGWMVTLNDFFINEGMNMFTVKNGKLSDGDTISVMFTQNMGVDLGGTWGNSDTTLQSLAVEGGMITPTFTSGEIGGVHEYALMISGDSGSVRITPTASNKNYLVKTFLNEKVRSNIEGNSYYKRTEFIPVRVGDMVYVGVGENAWPSMNNQGAEARSYSPTWYVLHVISAENGADHVNDLIAALPKESKITYSNYKTYQEQVDYIQTVLGKLSTAEKSKVNNAALDTIAKRVEYFKAIDDVKALLAAVPEASKLNASAASAVRTASRAYNALSDEQQLYITVGDVAKFNAAVAWLKAYDASFDVELIEASTEKPVEGTDFAPEATVSSDGSATAEVSEKAMESLIEAAKEQAGEAERAGTGEQTVVTIKPEIKGEASSVAVELPAASAETLAKDTDAILNIETEKGTVSISNEALASITQQAEGDKISIEISEKETEKLESAAKSLGEELKEIETLDELDEAQTKALGEKIAEALGVEAETVTDEVIATVIDEVKAETLSEAVIVEVTVKSGDKQITNFGGAELTLELPISKEHEEGKSYKVIAISADGTVSVMIGTVKNGKMVVKTTHLTTFIATTEQINPFTDIAGNWAADAIQYAYANGLMQGIGNNLFNPAGTVTRGMVVTTLYRMEKEPVAPSENPFSDVEAGTWYTDAVLWAAENKIVQGYDGKFMPTDTVTREQFAAMLYNYAAFKKYDVSKSNELSSYDDAASISPWALTAMQWANAEGLVTGRTASTLVPSGTATRAEMASLLQRFIAAVVK